MYNHVIVIKVFRHSCIGNILQSCFCCHREAQILFEQICQTREDFNPVCVSQIRSQIVLGSFSTLKFGIGDKRGALFSDLFCTCKMPTLYSGGTQAVNTTISTSLLHFELHQ